MKLMQYTRDSIISNDMIPYPGLCVRELYQMR